MKYRFLVEETRQVTCEYEVEADSLEEAQDMAENGETDREETFKLYDITDRQIIRRV